MLIDRTLSGTCQWQMSWTKVTLKYNLCILVTYKEQDLYNIGI